MSPTRMDASESKPGTYVCLIPLLVFAESKNNQLMCLAGVPRVLRLVDIIGESWWYWVDSVGIRPEVVLQVTKRHVWAEKQIQTQLKL